MEEENLYAVLRLEESGPQVVHALIRKAYRKRALELHPDKRGDDPVAAVEFQKLQKAYDILSDEKARASYDELQRVRKERVQKESRQSEKRQKMMRDLAEKEKAYEREKKVKTQEDDVSRRLKAEIAKISKNRGRQFKGPASFDQKGPANGRQGPPSFDQGKAANVDADQEFFEPPIFNFGKAPSEKVEVPSQSQSADVETSGAERTLKVSWSCLEGGAGDYSATELKQIFEEFGVVEDLVVRSGKSRKKRSALIVMATEQAAVKATENVCGEYSNPFRDRRHKDDDRYPTRDTRRRSRSRSRDRNERERYRGGKREAKYRGADRERERGHDSRRRSASRSLSRTRSRSRGRAGGNEKRYSRSASDRGKGSPRASPSRGRSPRTKESLVRKRSMSRSRSRSRSRSPSRSLSRSPQKRSGSDEPMKEVEIKSPLNTARGSESPDLKASPPRRRVSVSPRARSRSPSPLRGSLSPGQAPRSRSPEVPRTSLSPVHSDGA